DCLAAFQRVFQVWGHLMSRKRLGQGHGIDKHMHGHPPGNQRVLCPACFRPFWHDHPCADQIPEGFEHAYASTMTVDGNHHLNKLDKPKRTDPEDRSLWAGRGYIPDDDAYRAHIASIPNHAKEYKGEGDCDYLNAVQKQKLHKFKGQELTGVVHSNCEHVFVQSSVDLQGGESLKNSDYAIAHTLRMFRPPVDADKDTVQTYQDSEAVLQRYLTYDSYCIAEVNMKRRFKQHHPDVYDAMTRIHGAIPAVHVVNHKERCRYEFATAYLSGFGHFHGETVEHYWAEINQIGPMIRQMNGGRRHDTLNDHHGDWNWKKTIKLGNQLYNNLLEAKSLFRQKLYTFRRLTASLPNETISRWKALSRTFSRRPGNTDFCSVYRHKTEKVPSQHAIYHHLLDTEKQQETRVQEQLSRAAVTEVMFLNEGLNIQDAQRKCRSTVQKGHRDQVASHQEEISSRRAKLISRIVRWRETQAIFMPAVAKKLESLSAVETEDEVLWLPSDLSDAERHNMGLTGLANLEIKLREGECFDAINSIRSAVKSIDAMHLRTLHLQGSGQHTRSIAMLEEAKAVRTQRIERYESGRMALVRLGYEAD
ncbi:hypothetical protein K488DRAFT_75352, partial [Vararia minispora EC-137]